VPQLARSLFFHRPSVATIHDKRDKTDEAMPALDKADAKETSLAQFGEMWATAWILR
jgi:hypothetical protein